MTDLVDADFFSDPALAQSPYAYFDALREQNPVFREPHQGVVAVTGYQEVMAAFKDHATFSAVNAIGAGLGERRRGRQSGRTAGAGFNLWALGPDLIHSFRGLRRARARARASRWDAW